MKKLIQFLFLFYTSSIFGQDIHLSQFYNAPMLLNPSNTGLFEGQYRIGGFYRNQWSSVTTPYQTFGFSGEFSLFKDALDIDYLGIGMLFTNDKAGDGNFSTRNFSMNVAYHKGLNSDYNHYFSAGFKAGVIQRNLDITKLYFDNQLTETGYDIGLPNGENLDFIKVSHADYAAGITYFNGISDMYNFTFGASYHHIKKQDFTFFENKSDILYSRYNAYASLDYNYNEFLKISPRIIYQSQGPSTELIPGIQCTYMLTPFDNDTRRNISGGLYWRSKDAVIIMAKTTFIDFTIGLSYDINLSTLSRASGGNGGPEITFEYMGFIPESNRYTRKSIKCPKL